MKVETSFLGGFKLFKNDNIIIGENLGDLRFSLKMMQTVWIKLGSFKLKQML